MGELKDKLVLVVDDEDRNTFALTSYLETLDMKIVIAKNGQEALQSIEQQKPSIILLDMMMPVMDGYETLYALKQNEAYKAIPVIAVTARAMKGDKERCLEAGAWDYVSKPIDLRSLVEKIIKWIS